MTLADPKPGGWSLGDKLLSAEMDIVRSELMKAVDGTDGGTYTLSANLTFAGAGEVRIDNVLRVRTGADFILDSGSQFAISGPGDFFDDVIFNDDVVFLAGGSTEFRATHAVEFGDLDDLSVNADSHEYRVPLMWAGTATNGTIPYWEVTGEGWVCSNVSASALLYFSLPMMAGDILTELKVAVTAGNAGTHGGVDPTNKMRFRILEASAIDTSRTALVTVTHPGTGVTYDGATELSLFSIAAASPVTVLDRQYFLEVRGENGGTAANLENLVRGIKATITRNKLASTNVLGA